MTTFKREPSFKFNGKAYPYWDVRKNERCVEVALGIDFLKDSPPRVMEVGNVMRSHQGTRKHFVIDLAEKHPGWNNYRNLDLLKWKPNIPVGRVLSISTIEHCTNPLEGVNRVLSWGPDVLITLPFGYNCKDGSKSTDLCLHNYTQPGTKTYFMARLHAGSENWKQYTRAQIEAFTEDQLRWNKLYSMTASAIAVIRKSPA